MAGDWLKMTHALPEKPEVLAIAGKTGLNRFEVVGRLFTLWRWFDINTTDGNAAGVTSVTLNECLFGYGDATGFVTAVVSARWLNESEDGISVVKFDEHISESAKTRAQTAKRVAKSKAKGKGNAQGNADTVTDGVTKTVPREEKRREDKEEAQAPSLPDWIPADAWAGYLDMRKKIKKVPTERALKLVVKSLDAMRAKGIDIADVLDNSTRNSWVDVYEPKGTPAKADDRIGSFL